MKVEVAIASSVEGANVKDFKGLEHISEVLTRMTSGWKATPRGVIDNYETLQPHEQGTALIESERRMKDVKAIHDRSLE